MEVTIRRACKLRDPRLDCQVRPAILARAGIGRAALAENIIAQKGREPGRW